MTASSSEPTAIAWIESEVLRHHGKQVELPTTTSSLCEFLRDGRALCLLTAALAADADANNNDDVAIPKKIEKAMHQLSTFHALERIHFFIKWCRTAVKVEEHLVFTSVQLLDDTNADAVLATVDALRLRFRPTFAVKAEIKPTPTPEHDDDDDDNNATETSSVSSSRSSSAPLSASSSSASNKLSAFLTKVPSAPPSAPPPTIERATSLSSASLTSSQSRHAASSVSSSDRGDDDDRERSRSLSNGRLSASPRAGKLKMPGAFASLATVSLPPPPPVEEEEAPVPVPVEEPVVVEEEVASSTPNRDAVDTFDERIKVVSKLEIPTVFGRQRSASNVDDAASVTSDSSEPSAKAVARSVSKLRIPAAFAGGDAAPPPPVEEEEPVPVLPEEPVSNSPKSKLAAFAKTLAPTPPTAEATPAADAAAPSKKKKSTGKLKIPAAFGKAVGAMTPVPKKKPVTKLSAFLSTVENDVPPPIEAKPERRFAFPIPGTAEAKNPVKKTPPVAKPTAKPAPPKSAKLAAFMTKVVAGPPKPAPRVERDTVPDHTVDDATPMEKLQDFMADEPPSMVGGAAVEEKGTTAPPPSSSSSGKASALAAFMKKVVVAPPAPAPRVERDTIPSEEVVDGEEATPLEDIVAADEAPPTEVEVEESGGRSRPQSNRLHAFLAAVESPTASLSEEEDAEDVAPAAATSVSAVKDEYEEDEAEEEEVEAEEEEDPASDVDAEEEEDNDSVAAPVEADATVECSVEIDEEPTTSHHHLVEDDDHDDFPRPAVESFPDHDVIVEVSGELTHEAIARRRLSLSSPRKSTKTSAARKLFHDHDEEEEAVSSKPPVVVTPMQSPDATRVADTSSVSLAALKELEDAKHKVEIENTTLRAELETLRQQLETQQREAETAATAHRHQLEALETQLADQQIVLTQAKESEEAARYAAQQAFTARDEAEDARRVLQERFDALPRAA